MGRSSYSAVLAHASDADFRAWGLQLSSTLQASGLVKTTDTGQVDWVTVTRPATTNTYVYEMYRFDDVLQATQPVFVRVEYGNGSNTGLPSLRVSAGPVTNGAGTLTSTSFLSATVSANAGGSLSAASTYACHVEGYFALAWGMNVGNAARGVWLVERTRGADGASNGAGIFGVGASGGAFATSARHWSYVTNTVLAPLAPPCLGSPDTWTSSTGAVNLYNWYAFTPDLNHLTGLFTYKNGEIAKLTELDAAIVGATSRHYITLGTEAMTSAHALGGASDVIAIRWEA